MQPGTPAPPTLVENAGNAPRAGPRPTHEQLFAWFAEQQQLLLQHVSTQQSRMLEQVCATQQQAQNQLVAQLAELWRTPRQPTGDSGDRGLTWTVGLNPLKLMKMGPQDDVEAFLNTFERVAEAAQWPREQWALILTPCLTGPAQEAVDTLAAEDAKDYGKVKATILQTLNISEDTYRLRLREMKWRPGLHPRTLGQKIRASGLRWLKPAERTSLQVAELIMVEQFVGTLPSQARNWVRCHKPQDLEAAVTLMEAYSAAEECEGGRPRRSIDGISVRGGKGPPGLGRGLGRGEATLGPTRSEVAPSKPEGNAGRSGKEPSMGEAARKPVVCYTCGVEGHIRKDCPVMECSWADSWEAAQVRKDPSDARVVNMRVNGKEVRALVDSGCNQTLVREAPGIGPTQLVNVRCIHGDLKPYKAIWVNVEVAGIARRLRVGVVPTLRREALLGRDWLEWRQLLQEREALEGEALRDALGVELVGVKRAQVVAWQQDDPVLREAWRQAQDGTGEGRPRFELRGDLLYRVPPLTDQGDGDAQLVVPKALRNEVMRLAHDVPMAGHLGVEKTTQRVLQRFFWPGVYAEVKAFCKSCPQCQLFQEKGPPGGKLIPMPIVEEPFSRISMDIVGPLEQAAGGFRYILVVVDCATRYPEAVPLRSIQATRIAQELVKIFSRVGFPKEILTDQGSNFMSQTLQKMWELLRVKPLRTSIYHPQANGMVERFNRTLKGMLRKFVESHPKSWPQLVEPLLFAFREVPQSSLGFSPFELVYGRRPRGILDIVKEGWEEEAPNSQTELQFVLRMRQHLKEIGQMARENLQKAQEEQKRYFDSKVKERSLQVGQQVLVLLPAQKAKLFAKWQGPFEVVRRVGPVDYEVKMGQDPPKTRVFHINLLKAWRVREALFGEVDPDLEEEEEWLIGPQAEDFVGTGDIPILSPLSDTQRQQATWTTSGSPSLLEGGSCSKVDPGVERTGRTEVEQVEEKEERDLEEEGREEQGGSLGAERRKERWSERRLKGEGEWCAGGRGRRGRGGRGAAVEAGIGQVKRSPGREGCPVTLQARPAFRKRGPHQGIELRDPRTEGEFNYSDEELWGKPATRGLEDKWWDEKGEKWESGPIPSDKDK
ncbi:uncharacterized protein LOC121917889, partial [Sceloporus undulatus]|uniref:uncharacterized protein LOC121917889 n=1 Tax=Sceloporus undulatus TaxID=8520 RepID=UPI001C4AA503